jgi:hypothetical protein
VPRRRATPAAAGSRSRWADARGAAGPRRRLAKRPPAGRPGGSIAVPVQPRAPSSPANSRTHASRENSSRRLSRTGPRAPRGAPGRDRSSPRHGEQAASWIGRIGIRVAAERGRRARHLGCDLPPEPPLRGRRAPAMPGCVRLERRWVHRHLRRDAHAEPPLPGRASSPGPRRLVRRGPDARPARVRGIELLNAPVRRGEKRELLPI